MNVNISGIHDNNIIVDNNLRGTLFNVDANLKSFTILFNDYTSRRRPRGVGITAWSPPRGGGWVQ
jgi:hypothetical protein